MSNTASASLQAPPDVTIGVRLPASIVDAVKAKREAMAAATPGATITISDAVRSLLIVGIAAQGGAP